MAILGPVTLAYCGSWGGGFFSFLFSFPPPSLVSCPAPPPPAICSVVKLILTTEAHHLPTISIGTVIHHYPEQGYLGKPSLWAGLMLIVTEKKCYTNPTLCISPGRQAADLESTYGWFSHFPQKSRNWYQDGRLPGQQVPRRDCRTSVSSRQLMGQNQGLHHSNLLSVGAHSGAYGVCSLLMLYVIRCTYKPGSDKKGQRHLNKLSPKSRLKN